MPRPHHEAVSKLFGRISNIKLSDMDSIYNSVHKDITLTMKDKYLESRKMWLGSTTNSAYTICIG